jgi:hypothetical protein
MRSNVRAQFLAMAVCVDDRGALHIDRRNGGGRQALTVPILVDNYD